LPRSPRPSIKLLHTADLHLGDDYWERRLAHAALIRVVDVALAEQVDAAIVAGDLFDRNRTSPEDTEFVLSQLARLARPVIILPGNHDSLDAGSVYLQTDFTSRCPHVRVLTAPEGEAARLPDLHLTVWGKPVIDHEPAFNPIAGIPAPEGNGWHVAVAHGLLVPDDQASDRSSPIRLGEISGSRWDYIALGHVHSFRDVSQGMLVACYSGTPVHAGHYLEGSGAVLIVDLDEERGVTWRRMPVGGL
jgi:DNA repair exonuclease SbcCD nuclease subunit